MPAVLCLGAVYFRRAHKDPVRVCLGILWTQLLEAEGRFKMMGWGDPCPRWFQPFCCH